MHAPVRLARSGKHAPITVTPGILDANAIDAYATGQCSALTQALTERITGARPIMVCFNRISMDDPAAWERRIHGQPSALLDWKDWVLNSVHALTELPDGRVVDIVGAHDPEMVRDVFRKQRGSCAFVYVRTVELERIPCTPPLNHEVAGVFADSLIAKYNLT